MTVICVGADQALQREWRAAVTGHPTSQVLRNDKDEMHKVKTESGFRHMHEKVEALSWLFLANCPLNAMNRI